MKPSKAFLIALVGAVALLPLVGCDDDDDVFDVPVDEAVESGLDEALTTTAVPLVEFMGTVADLLTSPIARATAGLACPSTTGWCTSGTVVCSPGVNGLDFDFDECLVAGGDVPLTLDGDVTAIPGNPVFLTLTNLFINDSPAISGTGSIDTSACDYTVNVQTNEATIAGTVTSCDADPYPTGDQVVIGFSDFLVTVFFDGTNPADATATRDGLPVVSCTIDLDTITSTCDAI